MNHCFCSSRTEQCTSATYARQCNLFLWCCSGNKSAWQEEELQSECGCVESSTHVTIIKTYLTEYFPIERILEILSDLVLVRGKGTHYKSKAGGWKSVTGCGSCTCSVVVQTTNRHREEGCRRSSITKCKAIMRQMNQ